MVKPYYEFIKFKYMYNTLLKKIQLNNNKMKIGHVRGCLIFFRVYSEVRKNKSTKGVLLYIACH